MSAELGAQMTPGIEKCFQLFKITDPAIQQKILTDHNFKFKEEECFMKCIFEGDKLVTADGKIIPQTIKAIATQHKKALSDQQIAKCNEDGQKAGGADACKVAVFSFGCVLKQIS